MVNTLERASTSLKSTYSPPNPKPLLPDLEPPQKTTSEPEEPTPPSESEESTPPSELEEPTQSL